MKFFIDSADIKELSQLAATGLVDGVTTNPSLVAKTGQPFFALIKKICEHIDGPVSAEVVATDTKSMLQQAETLAKLHDNVVVKIPLTPDGLAAVRALREKSIRTNVTLCFSANQALLAARTGATYISPFIGRLDDIGEDGVALIRNIRTIYDTYKLETRILAASIRSTEHVCAVAMAGADCATIPPKLMWDLFAHPLTDTGLEAFLDDWKKSGTKFG